MKIITNGEILAVTGLPGITEQTVRYPLSSAPAAIGETVRLENDSGAELRTDAVADWLRCYMDGTTLVLTNLPEPEPPEPPHTHTPTPRERREAAYDAERCIPWQGENITVTVAAGQWTYYESEGDRATADALTALIAAAKAIIREKFPDNEE